MITRPTFEEETFFWKKGYQYIVGIDEVGRGAFAGPVVVGAVVFSPNTTSDLTLIHDSKLLKPHQRVTALTVIKKYASFCSTEQSSVSVINRIGVGKATEVAFRKVIQKVQQAYIGIPLFVLVDGFYIKYIRGIGLKRQKAIIKGDQKSISIAAASIIAKVTRDEMMTQYHDMFPLYGFKKHKGYGTREHQEAIRKYNLCKLHRTSFDLSPFVSG